MNEELPDAIFEQVTTLAESGNTALDYDDPAEAISCWRQALKLLPSPELQWSAAMWLHASIGDAQRQQGELEPAVSSFQSAAAADGGAENAFVQFGLGATLLDLHRREEATDPLLRAYMLAGDEIFQDQAVRYREHLAARRLII